MKSSRGRTRLYRLYRYTYLRLLRQHHEPERVGRGAALGVFIGIFPTLWLGPVLAVVGAGVVGANRAAALASLMASGPLWPVWWFLSVHIGNVLVAPEWRIARELLEQEKGGALLGRFFGTFLLGNTVVSAGVALVCYFLGWWLARRYRQFRAARRPALSA